MHRLVITAIVLAACSSAGPRRIGVQPSWREGGGGIEDGALPPAQPITFTPRSEPAASYNAAIHEPPRTLLNDAVIAVVRDAAVSAGVHVPVPDGRLFAACADLAEIVPENEVIDYKLVEFALQHHGIIEPSPRLLVIWGAIDAPQAVIEQLAPMLGGIFAEGATARIGIGAARRKPDGTGALVFALQASGVTTAPFPRVVGAGTTVTIEAVIDPRYHDPELFVTRDDGESQRLALTPGRAGGVTAQISCSGRRGRQQVEITGSDDAGSTVLANFPLWCAVSPPRSLTVAPTRDGATTPREAERQLLTSVNRDRIAARLPPLTWDDRLAEVARRHSDEMRRTHVVAHISKTTGSASDRLAAAQVRSGVVLENVARAYGVEGAHDGLMNSPGHRLNLMSRLATHVGIGVVFGNEVSGRYELFVTQVFTRVPPRIQPATAIAAVRAKVAAVRGSLTPVPRLDVIAQRLAAALAAGTPRDAAYAQVQSQIDGLGGGYRHIDSAINVVGDLDGVEGGQLIGSATGVDIGLGIAQGPHDQFGDNAIWIIVLFGRPRTP